MEDMSSVCSVYYTVKTDICDKKKKNTYFEVVQNWAPLWHEQTFYVITLYKIMD